MKTRLLLVATVMVAIAWAVPASAQTTATAGLTISASVSAIAKLTVSTSTLTFPNTDPDTGGINISPTEGVVSIAAKAKSGSNFGVTLTLKADDDSKSGSDVITIDKISWTASGTSFVAGTMSRTAQTVASWTGSGNKSGTQTFSMLNSWDYPVGSYTATAVYTLTSQ